MTEQAPQKDAMDVLQAWVDDFNARAGPAIRLGSAGEAGGAQLRLRYSPADGEISILHLVAVERAGRAAILVRRFDGPTTETALEAGLWARRARGRRRWGRPARASIPARSGEMRARRSPSTGAGRWRDTAAAPGGGRRGRRGRRRSTLS